MFAAPPRILCTLALTAIVGGFGVSQDLASNGPIRLVAGKQPGSRGHHVTQAVAQNERSAREATRTVGLLDRLRAIGAGVSQEYQAEEAELPKPPPADWTGVPYHEPNASRSSRASRPITDPNQQAAAAGRVAVSPRTSRAAPRKPATVPVPTGVGRIPTPPAEGSDRPSQTATQPESPLSDVSRPEFSPTYSSRRSNRRPVAPLSDVVGSPSDRPAATESLARSSQDPVIDVEGEQAASPQVQQRPLPQRETAEAAAGSSRRTAETRDTAAPRVASRPSANAESGQQPAFGGTESPVAASDSSSEMPTPPSLAADRSGAPTSPAPQSSRRTARSANGGRSQPLAPSAQPAELAEAPSPANPAAEPVGSGIDPSQVAAEAKPSLAPASGFQQRSTESSSAAVASDAEASAETSGFRSEVPAVRVVAAGPAEIMIRQQTPYEIQVENRGSLDAPGVLVRAQLPAWAKLRKQDASSGDVNLSQQGKTQELMWQIDNLAAGASEKLALTLQAEQSGSFQVKVDWTLLPRKEVMQVNVREPKLDLVIEGPDQVIYGESETYRVRVLNPGNGIASNVVFTLSPNSATPQAQKIGDIPPGKEAEFEVELTAQDLGSLQIHGLATGELALRTEEVRKIEVASAKLEATLSGPPLKYQNSEATYRLQLHNAGTTASKNVQASLQLPAGLTYLGGLSEATQQDETLHWTIEELPVDASRDFQIQVQMAATGTHRLAFQCQGTAAGKAAVSIDTQVEALADLVLTVNDPPAPAPVGKEVVYEITLRNRGSKAATAVQTLTHFGNGIEPIRIEGHQGDVTTGQVAFDPIPRIEAGETLTLRVIAQASSEGLHRFRTEVSSADTVLIAEEATRYLNAKTDQISRRSSDRETR